VELARLIALNTCGVRHADNQLPTQSQDWSAFLTRPHPQNPKSVCAGCPRRALFRSTHSAVKMVPQRRPSQ
jgi:TPP-dependent indolepyruvate ferredoxin oxidoreductase alpha subunit